MRSSTASQKSDLSETRQARHKAQNRILLLAVALIGMALVLPVHADVGVPPWSLPGSSIDSGETSTRVQMISENVLIVIEDHQGDDILPLYQGELAANSMVGHVNATFLMRNHGDETEAFDVWFPMWLPDFPYYGDTTGVESFAAWVDGVSAEVSYYEARGQIDAPTPWATWFVSFPPGQDVEIRVAYDVFPAGDRPYGAFHYILETGADWWGSIGEGTITYRLPYEVNESNVALNPDSRTPLASTAPNPGSYSISGADVVWRFTDLEPTAADNIQLTVMTPAVWRRIAAAQREAAANPDTAQAQLQLAHALYDGVAMFKNRALTSQANSAALADAARESFQRALDLSPEHFQAGDLVTYLKLLFAMNEHDVLSPPDDLLEMLERALEKDPGQVGLVIEYLEMLCQDWSIHGEGDTLPSDALLSAMRKAIEIAPDGSELVNERIELWGTSPTDTAPTQAVSPLSTPEPPALPTATPMPTPTAPSPTTTAEQSREESYCPGATAIALGALGMAQILQKRSRTRENTP